MDGIAAFGTPDIVQVAGGTAAVAWAHVAFAEIPAYQGRAIAEVDAALARAGLSSDGPRLTFSRAPAGDALSIAPGRVIEVAARNLDGVTLQPIPEGRAAHLRFAGPYAQLAQAWRALGAWVAERDLRVTGPCWEVYTDPSAPVTDLYMPLG